MPAVWFITGVSSGFGTEIALVALSSGQRIIGTVRNRSKAAAQVSAIESKGGKVLELDVNDAAACFAVFKEAENLHGQIDVLVNNAGFSILGAVEDFEYVKPLECKSESSWLTPFVQRRGNQSPTGNQPLRSSSLASSSTAWVPRAQEWHHCQYHQHRWH